MKKRTCWIAVLHLGLMTLLGGQCLWAADRERQAKEDDLSAKMRAEGWRQIAEGVFERRRGGAKVEHLAYGREGFAWFVGLLERRREALMRQYESYPSEDLARVIDNLDVTIARARRELRDMPERSPDGLTNLSAAVSGPSCNICYSATADAFHLTTSQGVGAIADAKFNNDCGNVGDTFAFAQARANLNGTQTVVTQEDPDTGTSITSHAAASVNGSNDCFSEAFASAQSSALGIAYSTSDINSGFCPVPPTPPSPTITGPSFIRRVSGCATYTWTASVSGGTAPYSYQWYYNNSPVGTNSSSYSRSVCFGHADFQLKVVVTDSSARTGTDLHDVTVESDACPTCIRDE